MFVTVDKQMCWLCRQGVFALLTLSFTNLTFWLDVVMLLHKNILKVHFWVELWLLYKADSLDSFSLFQFSNCLSILKQYRWNTKYQNKSHRHAHSNLISLSGIWNSFLPHQSSTWVPVLCESSLCLLYYMAHHCVWFALGEANSLWYVRTPFWPEVDSACAVSCNFLSGTNLASVQPNLLLLQQGVVWK